MAFLIFFVIISLLILSHELGHFLAAKSAGVKVLEFGFGFPPKLFWFKRGDTVYSFNIFPLGGFVKILGEDENAVLEEKPSKISTAKDLSEKQNSFAFKPAGVRAFILSAGVLFNLLLAWMLISAGLAAGSLTPVSDDETILNTSPHILITDVLSESPAERAGLMPGDILFFLSSGAERIEVSKTSEVQNFINSHRGKEIEIAFKRGGTVKVSKAELKDIDAQKGALGIGMARVARVAEPWHLAILNGLKQTAILTIAIAIAMFDFFAGLFKGVGFEQVAGPIGIFSIVSEASRFGFSYLAQLSALLSINLAIINFLPFPALDGGRLLFLIIEKMRGKPVSEKTANLLNSVGFSILIILMALVTYNDIARLVINK